MDIACGASHTLALSDKGEVWGWGRNNFGQLGIGDRDLLGDMGYQEWIQEPRLIPELSEKSVMQVNILRHDMCI